MKTELTTYIAFILTALFVTNCTIEKRLFQPGYSVEWKKKIPERNAVETENHTSYSRKESDSIPTATSLSSLSLKPDPIPTSEFTENISEPLVSIEKIDAQTSHELEKKDINSFIAQKKSINPVETEDKKELEIFGAMSFGLYFCCVILTLLGVFVLNLPIYLFVIAGFMLLLSLIFGIISVDKYRRNRSRYYRNFFGYFGLIASAITISVVALFLILVTV